MLISSKMNAAINQQIGNEFGASLQYVAIASHFAGEGLTALEPLTTIPPCRRAPAPVPLL